MEGFKKNMNDTFLITDRNAEELISKDKMRDRQQKEEDIAFLTSMKEDRIASVSSTALSSILLQTVSVGGGSIDTLPLSRRQV